MKMTMCGYCCELCKAYVVNISRKDERERLSNVWYNLQIGLIIIGRSVTVY